MNVCERENERTDFALPLSYSTHMLIRSGSVNYCSHIISESTEISDGK